MDYKLDDKHTSSVRINPNPFKTIQRKLTFKTRSAL